MTLTETTMTEQLDKRGWLDDAHGPGCYALVVDVPDDLSAAVDRWDDHHDARPPDDALARLSDAPSVAYVGASKDVYGRLCDHTNHVRKAAFLDAFPPERVLNIWPTEDPFASEFNRAMRLVQNDWTVWTDGEVLG